GVEDWDWDRVLVRGHSSGDGGACDTQASRLGNPVLLTGVADENRDNLEAGTGTGMIGIGAGLVGIGVDGVGIGIGMFGIRDELIGDETGMAGMVTGSGTWPSDRHRLEVKGTRGRSQWI